MTLKFKLRRSFGVYCTIDYDDDYDDEDVAGCDTLFDDLKQSVEKLIQEAKYKRINPEVF